MPDPWTVLHSYTKALEARFKANPPADPNAHALIWDTIRALSDFTFTHTESRPMSFFSDLVSKVENWFNTSPVGKMIENDVQLAIKELETVGVADLENVVKLMGTAILANLVTGGAATQASVVAAIEAGIAAAIPAFKAIGADVSSKTVNTLVTTVVNQLTPVAAQATPAA
jgi:hypothetical protein